MVSAPWTNVVHIKKVKQWLELVAGIRSLWVNISTLVHVSSATDMCAYIINYLNKCDLDLLPCESNLGQKSTNVLTLLYFTIHWS